MRKMGQNERLENDKRMKTIRAEEDGGYVYLSLFKPRPLSLCSQDDRVGSDVYARTTMFAIGQEETVRT